MKVRHRKIKFLSQYITGDKAEFIKNNIAELTALNTWVVESKNKLFELSKISKHYDFYISDTLRFIALLLLLMAKNTQTL